MKALAILAWGISVFGLGNLTAGSLINKDLDDCMAKIKAEDDSET